MTTQAPVSHKALALSWLALVVLSVITVTAGNYNSLMLPAIVVLLAGISKAWVIIDHFMELRRGPHTWKIAMLGWPFVMAIAIGVTFAGRLSAG